MSTPTDKPEAPPASSGHDLDTQPARQLFSEWLAAHRNGALDLELTEALAEVVDGVTLRDRAGEIRVGFKIKTGGNGLIVSDAITAKPPAADEPTTFYYPDGQGGLSRRDPNQPSLPYTD